MVLFGLFTTLSHLDRNGDDLTHKQKKKPDINIQYKHKPGLEKHIKYIPAFRLGLFCSFTLTAMLGSSECFFSLSAILSVRMEEGKRKRTFFTVLRVTLLESCQGPADSLRNASPLCQKARVSGFHAIVWTLLWPADKSCLHSGRVAG